MIARSLRLKIGISPRLLHEVPESFGFKGKTLQYLEQSVAHWAMAGNALIFMIPTIESGGLLTRSDLNVDHYADALDGLILQGGADVSPSSYGERPLQPQWKGDRKRDRFEIELLFAFVRRNKPVLGICRGMQLINVALGGTLYQDIAAQIPGALRHNDTEAFDANFHEVSIVAGSGLADLYPKRLAGVVNSLHHQAIKDLGRNLDIEAYCERDEVVEAVRWKGGSYVFGVQWHPEFHPRGKCELIEAMPILEEFLSATRRASWV